MVWVEGENEENGSAVLENSSGGSSKRKTEGNHQTQQSHLWVSAPKDSKAELRQLSAFTVA